MAVTTKRGGLEVDGLAQSIRALKRVDPLLAKEAVNVFRDTSKDVQKRAQASIGRHPRYRMGTQKGMIGRSATSTGGGVKLRASKYPWAYAAEYGENVANVFGPKMPQSIFARRTAAPYKPPTSSNMAQNQGGYLIQPAIRKRMPHIERQLSKGLTLVFDKALRKAGVPDG